MLMEMHSLVFPNTVFRSSFAQALPNDGLGLCGGREPIPAHTKVAYLWATRVPNVGPPQVQLQKALSLPIGMKAPLLAEARPEANWKYLDRARGWALEPEQTSHKTIPVPVHESADPKALEVDLSKVSIPPGRYHLVANWDWDTFAVEGDITVAPLSDFATAQLELESQDRLVTKTGKVPLTLHGSDFEFVTKVELAKPGDKFFMPSAIPFVLPEGFRQGPQTKLDVQVNTAELDPGDYRLLIQQPDGKSHAVPLAVLAAVPKITNLPIVINAGDTTREVKLRGEHLDVIEKLSSPGATISLFPASLDGSERRATLRFDAPVQKGQTFAFLATIQKRSAPTELPDAIRITTPRTRITDSQVSMPAGVDVAVKPGELPSNYFVSALLHVADLPPSAVLALECRGDEQSRQNLPIGTKSGAASAERLSSDELFLTFDDGAFPSGCDLLAKTTDQSGTVSSDPYELGRIVRVPKIESLQTADNPLNSGQFQVTITGRNLETIDHAGWDLDHPTLIGELPTLLAGEDQKQTLRISLPAPPVGADGPLYVWLRGESAGRASLVRMQASVKTRIGADSKTATR